MSVLSLGFTISSFTVFPHRSVMVMGIGTETFADTSNLNVPVEGFGKTLTEYWPISDNWIAPNGGGTTKVSRSQPSTRIGRFAMALHGPSVTVYVMVSLPGTSPETLPHTSTLVFVPPEDHAPPDVGLYSATVEPAHTVSGPVITPMSRDEGSGVTKILGKPSPHSADDRAMQLRTKPQAVPALSGASIRPIVQVLAGDTESLMK